jgi:hypothetical protein
MTLIKNVDAITAVNEGRRIPTFVTHEGVRVARLKYHPTDAWRGYYYVEPTKAHGWELLTDQSGWVTGDWDDAGDAAESMVLDPGRKVSHHTDNDFIVTGQQLVV